MFQMSAKGLNHTSDVSLKKRGSYTGLPTKPASNRIDRLASLAGCHLVERIGFALCIREPARSQILLGQMQQS